MCKRTMNKGLALLCSLLLVAGVFSGCTGSAPGESGGGSAAAKTITLQVVHGDGGTKDFSISTGRETLGEALEDEGLIEGEESEYGLFVKTVDGETADDGAQEWWCLTKGGEMWSEGVDSTKLEDGDAFEFTLTVGY